MKFFLISSLNLPVTTRGCLPPNWWQIKPAPSERLINPRGTFPGGCSSCKERLLREKLILVLSQEWLWDTITLVLIPSMAQWAAWWRRGLKMAARPICALSSPCQQGCDSTKTLLALGTMGFAHPLGRGAQSHHGDCKCGGTLYHSPAG